MQTFTQIHTSEYYYECDEDSNGYSNTTFADNGGAITFENISWETCTKYQLSTRICVTDSIPLFVTIGIYICCGLVIAYYVW